MRVAFFRAQHRKTQHTQLQSTLPDNPEWIDIRITKLFAMIQIDLRDEPVPDFLRHALRAHHAMVAYLQSEEGLEARLAAALNLVWLMATPSGTAEHAIIQRIIDKRIGEFGREVNAS